MWVVLCVLARVGDLPTRQTVSGEGLHRQCLLGSDWYCSRCNLKFLIAITETAQISL